MLTPAMKILQSCSVMLKVLKVVQSSEEKERNRFQILSCKIFRGRQGLFISYKLKHTLTKTNS